MSSLHPKPITPGPGDTSREPSDDVGATIVQSTGNRLRRWGFRLVAVLVIPALVVGASEITLRQLGTGYPAAFVRASENKPGYLVDNYKFAWRFFPRALARSSQPIMAAKDKPGRTKRIVVFGGSAAMGDPEPAYGLPRLLEVLLRLRFPDQEFEIINAAVTAVNSHVVLPVAKDCRVLDADAWVIYMGNNEVHGPFGAGTVFGNRDTPLWLIRSGLSLKRTRIGQLMAQAWRRSDATAPESWGGMEMFLDHQLRHDDRLLDQVHDHFAENLGDTLDFAAGRGIPVVVSTAVSNLKDCAPFVSLHGPALRSESLEKWKSRFERGCQLQELGQCEDAIAAFEGASRIDSEFAELQFRLGQCYLRVGGFAKAHECFQFARDYDALRFRASSTINEVIVATAANREGVALIDASARFDERSSHGITGDEFLYEHVHFNFAGNYLLARLFTEKLVDSLHLKIGHDRWASEQQCAEQLGLTPYHRLLIMRELKTRLRLPPFNRQINRQVRDAKVETELSRLASVMTDDTARDAIDQLRNLIRQNPSDWVLRKQFGALLESTGDLDGAKAQWVEITIRLPHYAEGYYKLGTLYNRAKQWTEAEQALRTALALRPEYARASNSLGISLSHLDRFDESYRHFARAIELRPNYAEAFMNWGLVLSNQGDNQKALERFHSAAHVDPDYLPAHVRLGKHYSGNKDFNAARTHYAEVVRLKPNDPAARLNLGLLYMKMERLEEAIEHLGQAVRLAPNNRLAIQALAQARRNATTRFQQKVREESIHEGQNH